MSTVLLKDISVFVSFNPLATNHVLYLTIDLFPKHVVAFHISQICFSAFQTSIISTDFCTMFADFETVCFIF